MQAEPAAFQAEPLGNRHLFGLELLQAASRFGGFDDGTEQGGTVAMGMASLGLRVGIGRTATGAVATLPVAPTGTVIVRHWSPAVDDPHFC